MSFQAAELSRSIQTKLEQLSQAVEEQRASDEFESYLNLMARFPRYSWGNCWLISMQRPSASMVAGFSQWKRLGRKIKAGEKAIRIMAPCPVEVEDKDGGTKERVFFKTACVFDVSQTEGKELPDFEVPEVDSAARDLLVALEQVAAQRGMNVRYGAMAAGQFALSKGGAVEIATGHSTGQQAKTLAHEAAHEALHRTADKQLDQAVSREVRELEAEAVAYVVCRHFGLDVELRASRYIALWGGDAKALAASFSRINKTARELIEDVAAWMDTGQQASRQAFAIEPSPGASGGAGKIPVTGETEVAVLDDLGCSANLRQRQTKASLKPASQESRLSAVPVRACAGVSAP